MWCQKRKWCPKLWRILTQGTGATGCPRFTAQAVRAKNPGPTNIPAFLKPDRTGHKWTGVNGRESLFWAITHCVCVTLASVERSAKLDQIVKWCSIEACSSSYHPVVFGEKANQLPSSVYPCLVGKQLLLKMCQNKVLYRVVPTLLWSELPTLSHDHPKGLLRGWRDLVLHHQHGHRWHCRDLSPSTVTKVS